MHGKELKFKIIFNKIIIFQYFDDENARNVRIGKLIPAPRINLAFENGKINYWNGK
jgi:hypothetical protein